jgi:hypothetical protein
LPLIKARCASAGPARELYLRLGFRVTRLEPPRVKMTVPVRVGKICIE